MEFLNDFGFNPILLLAQIINFLIVMFVLKKVMYKPLLDMIKKRESVIKKGLKDSEDANIMLKDAEEREREIIKKAQEKSEKIINDAKLESLEIRKRVEEQTKKESQRIIDSARTTIERESKEAEERLTQKIGVIAIRLLEKSLTGIFGEKEQKLIVKKAVLELQKSK